MKQLYTSIIILFVLVSCEPKDSPSHYFSQTEQDSLLVNMITLVAENAPGSNDSTRFLPQFRTYYVSKLAHYSIENLEKGKNDFYYFFLNRPVGHLVKYRRGVVGKFKLKEGSFVPYDFEEVINTPHLDSATMSFRAKFLFAELVKKDQLTEYIPLKHYVEWPDSTLQYNKRTNRWKYIGN